MVLPLYSGRFASCRAAQSAAPEEMPTSTPSSLPTAFPTAKASSLATGITSSYTPVFRTSGTKPAPMPWILWGPAVPFVSTGESAGSTATTLTPGFFSFRYSPTPVTVPPVPTPATKASTAPSVSRQISRPVPALWAAGLAGLTNWPAIKLPGISFASSSALAMAPFIPLPPSVSTSSAP